MKRILRLLIFVCAMAYSPFSSHKAQAAPSDKTAYDFAFEGLTGGEIPLSRYKGNIILVVNTASKCGFTPQYKALEALYMRYKSRGLVIIGVPSNDFGGQEPGSAEQIKSFCALNYGVTFPMAAKQIVSGKAAHPFYRWAYEVLGFGTAPKWNFHKYLIDTHGHLVDYFSSWTAPDSAKIIEAIEKLLPQKP